MSIVDGVINLLSGGNLRERIAGEPSDPYYPDMSSQIMEVQGIRTHPWRHASVSEAMTVPAILRAVTLISNTVGALSLEGYRQGAKLDQDDAPRIIVRPNPYTTPREFFRETAYSAATRGEFLWWIASRDIDGVAQSLYPMPVQEVTFEEKPRDARRPTIRWRDSIIPNEDVVHGVLAREPGQQRGFGPLQKCGAAISVALEAQAWAANFFAGGGQPSYLIKLLGARSEDEVRDFKRQWNEVPANQPHVIDELIDSVTPFSIDAAAAQLTDSRSFSNGEAALMFGIPGSLLDHVTPGASLTYQNVGQEYDKFVRSCLWPNYLEPIEQAMSDLLTRSTVARFNLDGLLRADIKTRFDVHKTAIESGVYDPDYARTKEGIEPGDVETAPVPFAPPGALPAVLPFERRSEGVRCGGCGRFLADLLTPPYRLRCKYCKTVAEAIA